MIDKLKNAWKSTTIWFNSMLALVLPFWDQIKSSVDSLKDYMTPENFNRIAITAIVVNILLRFKTNKGLQDK